MRHVSAIAGRELRSLFVSPVAYVVLTLFVLLAGFFFLLNVMEFSNWIFRLQQFQAFEQLRNANLNDHVIAFFYSSMFLVLVFLIPGITMGMFAAEKTNGTQELLLTSPLTIWEIVLGKFLAAAAFVTLLTVLMGLYPGLLFVYGDPELKRTLSGLLGLALVGWTYVAIGLFASSLTRSQIIAFFLSFVLLLLLLLLSALAGGGAVGGAGWLADLLTWLSTGGHFEDLVRGLVDTADLAYFAVMIGVFLILTKTVVESVRWR